MSFINICGIYVCFGLLGVNMISPALDHSRKDTLTLDTYEKYNNF